jgi:toxin ParE1/3/4
LYLPAFRRDILEVIAWSTKQFGAPAAERYGRLIRQALHDISDEPTRPGAEARSDLAPYAYVYHLSFSRNRVVGKRVQEPRHFVLYRYQKAKVSFARLLHESRDLTRHVPPALLGE